jgi:hypothetical protein
MGHSALTPETHKLLVRLIGNGNYLEVAAAAAGIAEVTLKEWLVRGREEGVGKYYDFYIDVMQAEALKENDLLQRVEHAGSIPEFWQASAWILARRFPKRWQEKVQLELANELERMLAHLEARLDTDTYTRVLEALADNTTRAIRRPVAEAQITGARSLQAGRPAAE